MTKDVSGPIPLKKLELSAALPPKFCFKSVYSNDFQVTLEIETNSETELLCISWSNSLCFRLTTESDRLKLQDKFHFDPKWSLYSVAIEHSQFAKWLHEESLEVRDMEGLWHFLVVSSDLVLDVLGYDYPILEKRPIDLTLAEFTSKSSSEARDLVYARSVGRHEGKLDLLTELIFAEISSKFQTQPPPGLIDHIFDNRNLETLMRLYEFVRQSETLEVIMDFVCDELN